MRFTRRALFYFVAHFLAFVCRKATSLQPSSTTIRKHHVGDYASHWENLLTTEYEDRASELRDRRKSWTRRRLEESGISIFGASAEPESEVLGEKIVRIYKKGETRFRDRFTRGDVLVMTPVINTVDPIPRECLIVDVGKDWFTVGVGSSWPDGLWEARKRPGFFRVRLDRTAPKAPLRAQRIALDRIRKQNGGIAAALLSRTFHNAVNAELTASNVPPRFGDKAVEEAIKDALNKAKKATSFQPNQSQQDAIIWALQRQISLIRGPPGTGKTRVAALLVSTALRLQSSHLGDKKNTRILAVTHSNGAADVLLEALLYMGVPAVRLGRPASVSSSVQHRTIIAMTEKMPQVIDLRQTAADTSLDGQLRSAAAFELKQCVKDIQEMITKTAPVVVTSCIGANQLLDEECEEMSFPVVVLDEAAQTTEPALLCALAASRAEQLILVGDTRQLPPTITSMNLRDSLGISPMARLEQCGVAEITLRMQYRMPSFLLEHPSNYFYKGQVSCADNQSFMLPPRGFPWPSFKPLAFVQHGNGDSEIAHNFGGRSNPTEADIVTSIVLDLLSAGELAPSNIAVISPYSKQVQRIRTELSTNQLKSGLKSSAVRVGTVDSFQGQETDVVVFSAVRSNPLNELGFLRDSRRLCVAITRARRGLILVGDKKVLTSCRHWAALLESCESRGCSLDSKDLMMVTRNTTIDDNEASGEKERGTVIDDALKELFDDNDEFYGIFGVP